MTTWKRSRIIEVERETDADKLRRLAAAIGAGRELSDDDRRDVARFLRHLADNPNVMKPRQRGRPRNSQAPHIALDYLVHRELHGKGTAAIRAVAAVWCDGKESSVKDAWTDWQAYARWKLGELTARPLDQRSREQLLRDISADLRESHIP